MVVVVDSMAAPPAAVRIMSVPAAQAPKQCSRNHQNTTLEATTAARFRPCARRTGRPKPASCVARAWGVGVGASPGARRRVGRPRAAFARQNTPQDSFAHPKRRRRCRRLNYGAGRRAIWYLWFFAGSSRSALRAGRSLHPKPPAVHVPRYSALPLLPAWIGGRLPGLPRRQLTSVPAPRASERCRLRARDLQGEPGHACWCRLWCWL